MRYIVDDERGEIGYSSTLRKVIVPLCLTEATVDSELPLFGDYWTFHKLGLWIAAGCALFATSIAFLLIFLHATHYSRPNEQRKYAKIIIE